MKTMFQKILHLFEELEEVGESTTLTISSKGGKSSIKLVLETQAQLQHQLLQQPIQLLHVTAITVVHQQGATLAASASVSPSPPDPGEACAPAGPFPRVALFTPNPLSGL